MLYLRKGLGGWKQYGVPLASLGPPPHDPDPATTPSVLLQHCHSAYASTEPEEEELAFLMEGVAELRLAEPHSRKRLT